MDKLCTHSSSLGKWAINKSFSLNLAEEIIAIHQFNIENRTNILKIDHKRQLSRVTKGKDSYVVKEFRRPGPWWILRPDAISWRNSHKLKKLNVPIPKVFAWLRSRDGRGFIIMEDLGDQVVGPILKKIVPDSSERIFLIEKIASFVGFLHSKNIVYGDLKLTNVIIRDGNLYLIDTDKIKIKKRLKLKDRIYNLEQILNSFPENITKDEIYMFFKTYLYLMGLDLLKDKLPISYYKKIRSSL